MAENKYHINKQTQWPNICRATVKDCPVGGEHFSSKHEAQEHMEKVNSATYGTAPSSMKKTRNGDGKTPMERAAEKQARSTKIKETIIRFDDNGYKVNERKSSSGYADNIVQDVTGVRPIKTLEKPDYYNSSLVEVDGEHYVVQTRAGEWVDDHYMYTSHVEKKTAPVLATTTTYFELDGTLDDERIALIEEAIKNKDGFIEDDGEGNLEINPYVSSFSENGNPREDGSTLYVVQLNSEGGQQFTDVPHPFQTDVLMEENGEKQNARTMDEGWAVYDTRSRKGIVLVHRSGSEGGYGYIWDLSKNGELSARDYGQRAYLLDGDGTTTDATYYELGDADTLNEWN